MKFICIAFAVELVDGEVVEKCNCELVAEVAIDFVDKDVEMLVIEGGVDEKEVLPAYVEDVGTNVL